jgi:hypothetical protein
MRYLDSKKRKLARSAILSQHSATNYEHRRQKDAGAGPGEGHLSYGVSEYELQTAMSIQDLTFPRQVEVAEKLMVLIVPEHDAMSGGIYSMFSIANQMKQMRSSHGYEVVLMTRPNEHGITHFRNSWFKNSENVYRFQQLARCSKAKEIYIHLPEYASNTFMELLDDETKEYLLSVDNVAINLLNQNIELMPEKEEYQDLREAFGDLTQSVAHHSYSGQDIANHYQLPTLLVPAYTDLTPYPASDYKDKENLIIYSLDEAPYKKKVLANLKKNFPGFEFVEIRGMLFDDYMEYATKCKFSITFGEGFDGYLAQPIYQGGIGFSVYNEDFFPSESFLGYENIFSTPEEMISDISGVMKKLMADTGLFKALNGELQKEYDALYSFDEYKECIRQLAHKEFEVLPQSTSSVASI